ncbi:MAG: RnfABCDGE type electron transport complex subunit D [Alistipes sp.]|nr:RnfABCDGE type electron transport complex subunit D [Alistipes sp.]
MRRKIRSQRFICLDILLTLLTLSLMEYFYYGLRAVVLNCVCVAASVIAELISLRLMKRKFTADDLTCVTDALIFALMLPAVFDMKMAAIACVFAVTAAKNLFGGRKNMMFSPAAAAYVFVLASWKNSVLMFTEPHVRTGIFDKAENLVSSVSHSFNVTGRMSVSDFELLMGNVPGSAGSVSILLLTVAAAVLIFRRDISAGAFIGTITGTALLACFVPMASSIGMSVKYTLSTNMVLFAAIYIVSDRRIAPKRNYYAFFYGLFVAVFSYILVLTTAKENAVIIASVIFTPAALGLRNLENKIEKIREEEISSAEKTAEIPAETSEEAIADE